MATWDATTLSTLNSIAKYEAEINRLSVQIQANCVAMAASARVTVSPNTLTSLYADYSDGSTELMTLHTTYWAIGAAAKTCIGFRDTVANVSFPVINSSGLIADTTNTYNITLSTGSTYSTYRQQTNWGDKITLAKSSLANDIKTILADRGYYDTDMPTGYTVLDYFEDLSIFNESSDYLTLSLIFQDLYKASSSNLESPFRDKAKIYRSLYNESFSMAMRQAGWGISGNYARVQTSKQLSINL